MKLLGFILILLTGIMMIYGTIDMPLMGDPHSPASTHISPRYIEKSLEETEVSNIVTAVLADYRSYDTLGETAVVFTAGIACLYILRKRKAEKNK